MGGDTYPGRKEILKCSWGSRKEATSALKESGDLEDAIPERRKE